MGKARGESAIIMWKKQVIKTKINKEDIKITAEGNSKNEGKYHFRKSKVEVPLTNNPELVPRTSTRLVHPVIKGLFTKEIPCRKTISVNKAVILYYLGSRNFINSKGVSDPIYTSLSLG